MLGRELSGIYSQENALEVVDRCVLFFLDRFTPGKRLGDLVKDMSFEKFENTFQP